MPRVRTALACLLSASGPLVVAACSKEDAAPPLTQGPPSLGAVGAGSTDAAADAGALEAGAGGAFLIVGAAAPSDLTLDSAYVYFTQTADGGAAAGSVMRVPRAGGTALVIAADEPGPAGLARVGSSLVWGNRGLGVASGGVRAVDGAAAPLPSPPRSVSTGEAVGPGLAHTASEVYWASSLTGAGFVIEHAAVPSGAPVNAGSTLDPFAPAGLAVGGGSLYVAANEVGGAVYRSDLRGGTLENLATFPDAVLRDVLLVGSTLYVTDARDAPDGTLWQVPTTTGVPVAFATGLARPSRLALDPHDPESLYVSLEVADGSVLRYPLAGGAPTVVAAHLPWPGPLTVDDAVYVATRNSVLKLVK